MHGRREKQRRDADVHGYPELLAMLMTTPGLAASAAAAGGVAQPGYQ